MSERVREEMDLQRCAERDVAMHGDWPNDKLADTLESARKFVPAALHAMLNVAAHKLRAARPASAEPVAWGYATKDGRLCGKDSASAWTKYEAERIVREANVESPVNAPFVLVPLYTTPPAAAQSHATALADAEREAARRAWDAARPHVPGVMHSGWDGARDRYLAREHPAPAPRECVLSDGHKVTYDAHISKYRRESPNSPGALLSTYWFGLVKDTDTGADFDALKAFATTEGAR